MRFFSWGKRDAETVATAVPVTVAPEVPPAEPSAAEQFPWAVPTGLLANFVTVAGFERAAHEVLGDEMAKLIRPACAALLQCPGDNDPVSFLGAGWVLTALFPPTGSYRNPLLSLPLVAVELINPFDFKIRLRPFEAFQHPTLAPWLGGPTLPHYIAHTMASGAIWASEDRSAPTNEMLELYAVDGQLSATATLTLPAGPAHKPYSMAARLIYGVERPAHRPEPEADPNPPIVACGFSVLGALAREMSDPAGDREQSRALAATFKEQLAEFRSKLINARTLH